MVTFYFYLSIATLTIIFFTAIDFYFGLRSIGFLKDTAPLNNTPAPKVSIIIPACNEQRNIEHALLSILNQDYANYEVVVINDRSTDNTGQILARMQEQYNNFKVITITELPEKWLGKNHALYRGANETEGDYILFTDADVMMKPSTLSRAINYMSNNKLDHLTISSDIVTPNKFLMMFASTFLYSFSVFMRPWKAKDKKSKCYIGIGAFNMLRRDAYIAAGGHKKIAMRPDDDIKLGKIIKKSGFSQELLYGTGFISVEWYDTVKNAIDGLYKNSLSIYNYNYLLAIIGLVLQLILNVWPFAAIFLSEGSTQIINIIILSLIYFSCWHGSNYFKQPKWQIIAFPIAILFLNYIVWRAIFLTIINGGIVWRGTHYSIKNLKLNKV